jgi:hypothetical protein
MGVVTDILEELAASMSRVEVTRTRIEISYVGKLELVENA